MLKSEPLNPYESPQEISQPAVSPRKQLLARLRGPSIGLLVLSGLQAGYLLVAFIGLVIIFAGHKEIVIPVTSPHFWGEIGWASFGFVPSAFIFIGAWQMRRMRSLRLCRAAAIVACIPFLSPVIFLGIPLGIWATIVLYQKSTAQEFNRPMERAGENLV